jgi:MFS family permease
MVGTILNILTKTMFALSNSALLIFFAKFSDRLSKGIRSAPTDALIADLSDKNLYASNFGYRQAFYTLGQVAGALLAMVILLLSHNNYRLLFTLAVIPAILATLVLLFLVKPNPNSHPRVENKYHFKHISVEDFKKITPAFWWLMAAAFFLMMARFSETFLILKAKNIGWSVAYLPLLIVIMDLVHAAITWPAGQFADRVSRKSMLIFGLMVMILAQTILAFVATVPGIIAGIILVGLAIGMTHGLLRALVAEATLPELRGTAFSLFFMISGLALLLGNTVAGTLSDRFGLFATFLGGALFTFVAVLILYTVFLREPARSIKPVPEIRG